MQRVAASILNNPVRVNVGRQDQLVANKDVKQHVQVVHQGDKYDKLAALMKAEHAEGNRTIIFCNKWVPPSLLLKNARAFALCALASSLQWLILIRFFHVSSLFQEVCV